MNRTQLLKSHDDLCGKAKAIMVQKNQDYAEAADPFRNFEGSTALGIHPANGILLRMLDKMNRVRTYAEEGKLLTDSFEDSIVDLINYSVLVHGLCQSRAGSGDRARMPVMDEEDVARLARTALGVPTSCAQLDMEDQTRSSV